MARALLCFAVVMLSTSCLVTDFAVDPETNTPLVVDTENVTPELTANVTYERKCKADDVEFDARSAVSDADHGDEVSAVWKLNDTTVPNVGGTGQTALRVSLNPCDYTDTSLIGRVALFISDRTIDFSTVNSSHPKDIDGKPTTLIQWTLEVTGANCTCP